MWENLLDRMLGQLIVYGRLQVTGPEGLTRS